MGHRIVQRAQADVETILLKVNSHTGIHSNEMADKLANAAGECCMSWHFDYNLMVSNDYTQPFKDNSIPRITQEDHSQIQDRSTMEKFDRHMLYMPGQPTQGHKLPAV